MVVGPHQVIAGGFAGRVRAVGRIAMGLGKGGIGLRQRAKHLVCGNMHKAECSPVLCIQSRPIAAHRFEQVEGAHDIRLDEFTGAQNGSVHMAFGCKVQDGAGLVGRQQFGHQRRITHVARHKNVLRVGRYRGQVLQIAGIGEFVQINHRLVRFGQPVQYKIAADKASSAGYQ